MKVLIQSQSINNMTEALIKCALKKHEVDHLKLFNIKKNQNGKNHIFKIVLVKILAVSRLLSKLD